MELKNKLFLVTGANGDLGFGLASELLRNKARICISCRTQIVADKTKNLLLAQYPGSEIDTIVLPMHDLSACQQALKIFTDKKPVLDGIINNAGIHIGKYDKRIEKGHFLTSQNFEINFQVNYLAPVLITETCMPYLAQDARVVHVFSKDYLSISKFDITDIRQNKLSASGHDEYARSKLALALYQQWSLHRYPNLKSFIASPGVTKTKLWDNVPKIILWFKKFHSVADGVVPIMQCLKLQEAEVGCFIGYSDSAGWQSEALSSLATNAEMQQNLWQQTQRWFEELDLINLK